MCKRQYTGKLKTAFNIRLHNHCKDVYKTNTPKLEQHFRLPGHNFNRHGKFTLIEQLNNAGLNFSVTPKISEFLLQYFTESLIQ